MDFPINFLEGEADVGDEESQQSVGNTEAEPPGKVDHGLLIEAIQGYPYLFDLSHKLYKDAKRKTLAWQHISELLNCAVDDCIKAWRNLRDRFVKEKNKLASGAGTPETNWPLYDLMLFYGKFTKPRKTHTSTQKKSEGSRSPRRPSPGSRPSSSTSTWSSVTYDTIMSPEVSIITDTQATENDEAPGPSNRADKILAPGGRSALSMTGTPTTSSGHTKKRKRSVQSEDSDAEVGKIMDVAKTIVSQLATKVSKNANTTLAEYICQELEKLSEVEAKKKRRKLLKALLDDDSD